MRCHLDTVLDKLKWDNLNARQWKKVENVTEILKPFADYTTLSSGEHYSTIYSIIPIIMELSLHLDRMNTRHGLSTVANILKKEMERRFTMFQDPHDKLFKPLYVVATFLDPRYRIVLSDKQKKFAKLYLLRKLNQTSDSTITPVTSLEPEDEGPPLKKFHLLNELIVERQKEEAMNVAEMKEVENYSNAKIKIVKDKDYDPLLFWSNNESVFPKLSVLAENLLVIPANSTQVKRVFSRAGYSTQGRRNRLSGVNLEHEVFLKTNKHYIHF